MAGDLNVSKVSLLLKCDGAVNSTAFPDASLRPKTVTAFGSNAKVVSGGKFSQAAGFSGSGDFLRANASAEFSFGAGDFTIETWASFASIPTTSGNYAGMLCCDNVSVLRGWILLVDGDRGGKIAFAAFSGGTSYTVTSTSVPALSTLMHVAVAREGTSLRMFIDGVLTETTTIGTATTNDVSAVPMHIGCNYNNSNPANSMNGLLDEIRITKGYARYTTNFTPPSAEFPAYAGTFSGRVKDSANANAARLIRVMREDTGALVGSVTSDGSTGLYSITTPYEGAHTISAYPAAGESLPALTLSGVLPA